MTCKTTHVLFGGRTKNGEKNFVSSHRSAFPVLVIKSGCNYFYDFHFFRIQRMTILLRKWYRPSEHHHIMIILRIKNITKYFYKKKLLTNDDIWILSKFYWQDFYIFAIRQMHKFDYIVSTLSTLPYKQKNCFLGLRYDWIFSLCSIQVYNIKLYYFCIFLILIWKIQ